LLFSRPKFRGWTGRGVVGGLLLANPPMRRRVRTPGNCPTLLLQWSPSSLILYCWRPSHWPG